MELSWGNIRISILIFKKTRIYALITLIGLGLFLSFFMVGIGVMGGPIILVACFTALSILDKTRDIQLLKKFNKLTSFNIKKGSDFAPACLGLIIFWWSVTGVIKNSYNPLVHKLNTNPPKYGAFTVNKPTIYKRNGNVLLKGVDLIVKSLQKTRLNSAWEFIWVLALFDYHHLFDRVYFRVVYFDTENRIYEPVKFFNDDGSIADENPIPWNEKILLTSFRIMDGVRTPEFKNKGTLPEACKIEMQGYIKYCAKFDFDKYKIAKIQIKQILQPFEYKGNYKEWRNSPWIDFYTMNLESKETKVSKEFKTYDYKKLKIEEFKNEVITPNF